MLWYRRAVALPHRYLVMRLRRVDVLHSFAIPLLGIGPVDVPAGPVQTHMYVAKVERKR